ncbi:hypothetical protein [Micromonospora sp. NPDC023814]|uniref:hypothetical protein n=1 Tax=Micromonospora sp. NPDC023814 TaxID=3154596 RepID=UPI00340B9344
MSNRYGTGPLRVIGATVGTATFHEDGLTTTYRVVGDHRYDRDGRAFAGEVSDSWCYLVRLACAAGVSAGGWHRAWVLAAENPSDAQG